MSLLSPRDSPNKRRLENVEKKINIADSLFEKYEKHPPQTQKEWIQLLKLQHNQSQCSEKLSKIIKAGMNADLVCNYQHDFI